MKITMMVLALAFVATTVKAYEIEGNPDRRMSFGVNYYRNSVNGDYEASAINFKFSNAGELTTNHFIADVRIPVASFLTLSLGGGYSMDKMRISLFKDDKYDMTGYNVNAGFRIYIP